ncbi:MAG: hypothetical protein ACE5JN_10485 [Candidatus Methylomirabilia bacterium]
MRRRRAASDYVVCLSNEGYRASLVVRRIYRVVADAESERRGLLRVVDESGADYLFPEKLFAPLDVPRALHRKLALATKHL